MTIKNTLGHLITCKDATHLMSAMQDRKLGIVERAKLRFHLACCTGCVRFKQQMEFLRTAMGKYRE
jgi:hypothetical protein